MKILRCILEIMHKIMQSPVSSFYCLLNVSIFDSRTVQTLIKLGNLQQKSVQIRILY